MSPEDFKRQSNVMRYCPMDHGILFSACESDHCLVLSMQPIHWYSPLLVVMHAFECDSVFNNFLGAITSSGSVVSESDALLALIIKRLDPQLAFHILLLYFELIMTVTMRVLAVNVPHSTNQQVKQASPLETLNLKPARREQTSTFVS